MYYEMDLFGLLKYDCFIKHLRLLISFLELQKATSDLAYELQVGNFF